MNNYSFLNIVNPQFTYALDCGLVKNDNKFFVVMPAFFGYVSDISVSIFLTISEKLLNTSEHDGLVRLIEAIRHDIDVLLVGVDDYIPGEDYFLSEQLYEFLITYRPKPPVKPDNNGSDSDDSFDSSDDPEPQHSWKRGEGITILHGKNPYLLMVGSLEWLKNLYPEEYERLVKKRKKEIVIMTKPEILEDETGEITEEEIEDEIIILHNRIVMKNYVIYEDYDPDKFHFNSDAYALLYEINIKDMRNLMYFYLKNLGDDYVFTDEQLCNIPNTYFDIIYKFALIQNPNSINNQIYDKVSKFYMNGGIDDALINLSLILGSTITTDKIKTLNCGCADNSNANNAYATTSVDSCKDIYASSMMEWLKKMFADPDYYYDWYFIVNTGHCPEPNVDMIDLLEKLLEEYLDRIIDNNSKIDDLIGYIHEVGMCCKGSSDNSRYKNIILNFIQVLEWIKNNDIDANINKIKIYGEEFASILPYLTCN